MKINLHYLPDKPYQNCEVLAFHASNDGERYYINFISIVHYCAKFRMFNTYDWTEIDDTDYEFNKNIVAWAYMDDVNEELNYEIQ